MVSHTPSVLGKKGMNSVADLQRAPRRGGGGGTRRCRSVNGVAASPVSQPCRCAEQQRARVFDFQLWSPEQRRENPVQISRRSATIAVTPTVMLNRAATSIPVADGGRAAPLRRDSGRDSRD
ncbi:hypothetical protein GYH30_047771 [Glycine max]|nr:hypothetical protein GYH30_047771 [Glycine max]